MDHDDYETLPVHSIGKNMLAGATAGVLEHCIMYPMDSVKVLHIVVYNYISLLLKTFIVVGTS